MYSYLVEVSLSFSSNKMTRSILKILHKIKSKTK